MYLSISYVPEYFLITKKVGKLYIDGGKNSSIIFSKKNLQPFTISGLTCRETLVYYLKTYFSSSFPAKDVYISCTIDSNIENFSHIINSINCLWDINILFDLFYHPNNDSRKLIHFSVENLFPWDVSLITLLLRTFNDEQKELFLVKIERDDYIKKTLNSGSVYTKNNFDGLFWFCFYMNHKEEVCAKYLEKLDINDDDYNGINSFMGLFSNNYSQFCEDIIYKYYGKKIKIISSTIFKEVKE